MTPGPQDPAGSELRANFGFSIEGLAPRDELLFKSLVRLLNHRTLHGWFYTPERGTAPVDLRVVSDHPASSINPSPAPYFQGVLTLSAVERFQPGVLMLPVRADLLEQQLNRLGQLIETTRRKCLADAATANAEAAPGTPFRSSAAMTAPGERPFFLSRWPSTGLLDSPARLRMATLLVGKSMTLAELARKTGQPLPLCSAFLDDLRRANLLTDGIALHGIRPAAAKANPHTDAVLATNAPGSPPVSRGLLSRIRSRLGL